MGPLSYMRSVVDRNVGMRPLTVLKKCTMQIYAHQVHMLFISAENTNPLLLLQGRVAKILTTYPSLSPSSSSSPPPSSSCPQGLGPRQPFRFQHKPEVSSMDVLCSFFPAGLYFIIVCLNLDLSILLTCCINIRGSYRKS